MSNYAISIYVHANSHACSLWDKPVVTKKSLLSLWCAGERPATVYHTELALPTTYHTGNNGGARPPTIYQIANATDVMGGERYSYHTVATATDEVGVSPRAESNSQAALGEDATSSNSPVYEQMPLANVTSDYQTLNPTYGVGTQRGDVYSRCLTRSCAQVMQGFPKGYY